MATVAASNFVSTSSCVNYGVTSWSESKLTLMKFGLMNHTMTHNGLRSLNKVDELHVRTMAKLTARQARSKTFKSGNARTSRTIVCKGGMNLIFVGAEVGPWSKTGGLGDVLGGLPPAMAANGHRVMTVSPRYDQYKDAWDTEVEIEVAFCIHNIAYQGRFSFTDFSLLNLPDELKSSFDFIDGYEKPVKGRKINWMKAGILESDKVLTVSPYYAQELVSGVDKGVELDNIIRKTGILGIVNGMDVQEWNPLTDKYTGIKYDASTVTDAKPLLKEALQAEVGLPVDRNIPVIGFIGRLEEQKGSDILVAAIPQFIKENVQIIVLGTGKKPMEKQLEQLEITYPDKARGVAKFNVPLAHMIIAGADFMLVPSRFEPCGLIQLHAMRYGTVPIVASTGGLVDTVKEGFTGFQMGSFNVECDAVDPADVTAVATSVKRALTTYGTPAFTEIIKNGMAQDLSWKVGGGGGPAKKWEEMLLSLGVSGSEPGIDGEEIAPLAKENVATP
uniref:Starch synthase catalytic domain-containing protein n=1 Tax=Fagus sylvatica TaxID=28930 RepID=A0A2N9I3P6_FAGSY